MRNCLSLFALALAGCTLCPLSAAGQEVDKHDEYQLRREDEPEPAAPIVHERAASAIVEQTNRFRANHEQEQVHVNEPLMAAARYFAEFMASHDKYGHRADGQRPADRAKKHGFDYCIVTENIAHLYSSESLTAEQVAEQFAEGWKESPEHRANMLDADVTQLGVAVAQSPQSGYYYAVQMFGRRRADALKFEIANRSEVVIEYSVGNERLSLPPRFIVAHEQCRQSEVVFYLPREEMTDNTTDDPERNAQQEHEQEQPVRLIPENGDHFVIRRADGRLTVGKQ